jgi:hypothetical protein
VRADNQEREKTDPERSWQDGKFPGAQPEYEHGSINLTWGLIVARLKEVVESGGKPDPALS